MRASREKWILLATFSTSELAEMAADILRGHDMRVWLKLLPAGMHPGLAVSIGSEIHVLEPDVEAAADLMCSHFGRDVLER